ncbi:MAG: tetratricopeptide repeat protein [Rhodocyclales bacterium]|nr:tetratricopeptide repeat protein [Rhodocyclales bacterium]
MSLINKMLRDLDARHIGEGERAALPAAVTPLAARQEQKSRPTAVALGLLVIVALAGALAWQEFRPDLAPIRPALPPSAPRPLAAPAPLAAPNPDPAPVATSPPAPGEAVPPTRSADVVPPPSALRMADELSAVAPVVPSPASAPAARSEPRPVAVKPAAMPATEKRSAVEPVVKTRIDKQERIPTAAERAEAEYQRAAAARRQGHLDAALAGYRSALEHFPEHAGARQGLAAQLIDARHYDDAEDVLRKGTEMASTRLSSTLALARLKVERNQVAAALELLQKNAVAGESSAEFQGFTGALLNRAGRSAEAVERYRQAARLSPGEGRWWAGLGISLDASGKPSEAREAYLRARQSPDLPPDLASHVDQRLR